MKWYQWACDECGARGLERTEADAEAALRSHPCDIPVPPLVLP